MHNKYRDLTSIIRLSHNIKSLCLEDTKERIVKNLNLILTYLLEIMELLILLVIINLGSSTILFALNEIEYFL